MEVEFTIVNDEAKGFKGQPKRMWDTTELCGDSQKAAHQRTLTAHQMRTRIGSIHMPKTRYHYNIMLRPEPEGGYTALVPALPGCVTYGRTVDEAREMAKDAISGYIASLRKHKDPIPTDDGTLVASLDFEYSR